jgi:NCAIR mutase (PurE)-related protein
MNSQATLDLLRQIAAGAMPPETALEQLAEGRRADLGFANLDLDRRRRRGAPEFIYCERKTVEQIVAIARALDRAGQNILCTRVSPQTAHQARRQIEGLEYHERAGALVKINERLEPRGLVAVVAAGTSDLPISEEAALTAEVMGTRVDRITDVGIAGLHRLLAKLDRLREADAAVVVAGMDGALPAVVAGLIEAPVIAVPTSVGYGACFGGLAPLLTMLTSCSPGVSVVNIDNGFGAGYQAAIIARRSAPRGGNHSAEEGVSAEELGPSLDGAGRSPLAAEKVTPASA